MYQAEYGGVASECVNEPGACGEAGQWARVTRVREGALWKGTVSGGGREMGQVLSMDKGVWEKRM